MSDIRLRRIESHKVGGDPNNMLLSVPIPLTSSGKAYQYSPNPDASPRLFLIGQAPADRTISEEHRSRIRRPPGPGQTVCPYSGYIAADREFVHFEDIEAIKNLIMWEAEQDIGDFLEQQARDFNRRQPRNTFISASMDVKRPYRPKPAPLRNDLLRNLECGICRRPYGVYAIALFCPDCGAPNLALHFQHEVQLVRDQVILADQTNEAGQPELAYRLMGNAHEDVLTAFETALKTVYRYLVRQHRPAQAVELLSKITIFQNIDRVRKYFEILAIDPFSRLTGGDLAFLTINIQKRHVIGHNLGIADEHYFQLAQDKQPGETVRLLGEEINRFAAICLNVISTLEDWLLPNAQLPARAPLLP